MKLPDFIRRLFTKAEVPDPPPYSGVRSADEGAIRDGLTYDQPAIWHRYMDSWPERAQRTYLRENDATFRFQFDTPNRGANDLAFAMTEDPLREWNWSTREYVLSHCHATYHRNPIAKRAVDYVAAFVVSQGFNLACKNKDVERVLTDFIDNPDNAIREYERLAVIDAQVDGELMLRYYTDGGRTVVVPQRPWECLWIRTEEGMFRRPISYRFQRHVQEGDAPTGQQTVIEDVVAEDIQFLAFGRHGYELRGRPALYVVLPWLRSYKEWLENRARQNYWRGALLYWVKLINPSAGVLAAKVAQYQKPPSPGSIAVTSDREEWQALTNPVGGSDAAEDGRQIKLMSAVGFGLPEYFLGDGANSNLASTKSQQLPVLVTLSEYQRIMIGQLWGPMFKRVLQNAIDGGLLLPEVEEQNVDGEPLYEDAPKASFGKPKTDDSDQPIKGAVKLVATLDAFDVSYEPLEAVEKFTLAQALQIAVQNEWVSSQTASQEMGFDYDIEKKRMAREEDERQSKVDSGQSPRPPVMRPDGMTGEPGQELPPEMLQQQDLLKQTAANEPTKNGVTHV